jgi:thiamine biosynthesis lipoprotein ApbE
LRIGLDAFECLRIADRVQRGTAGAFDVNFRKSNGSTERPEFELTASETGCSIRLRPDFLGRSSARLDLDLGAIGKGYALDKAASFSRIGASSASLSTGGQARLWRG